VNTRYVKAIADRPGRYNVPGILDTTTGNFAGFISVESRDTVWARGNKPHGWNYITFIPGYVHFRIGDER
jgi:hypothetical protein